MSRVEDARDLYALPLDEFTPARNELAARLRAAGDKGRAAEVMKLKKPNLVAWAINQVARRHPEKLDELAANAASIQEASDPHALRDHVQRRHALVQDLVSRGRSVLEESGHAAGANALNDITQTFYGATSPDDSALLVQGTLTKPLAASGLDQMLGIGLVGDAMDPGPARDRAAEEMAELEERARRADAEVSSLEAEVERARIALDDLEGRLLSARREAERYRDRLDDFREHR